MPDLPDRQLYENPPLREAVIGFKFAAGPVGWDSIYFGKIHQALEAEFPRVETLVGAKLEVNAATPDQATLRTTAEERKRFLTAEGGLVVTVGPNMLGLSILPEKHPGGHVGWPKLFETALRILRMYERTAAPGALQEMGVRYINALLVNRESFVLGSVISAETGLVPTRLLEERNPFVYRYEHTLAATSGHTHKEVLQLVAQTVDDGSAWFVLDIDQMWQAHGDVAGAVEEVGNHLHGAVYNLFHLLFRAEAKARFGPVHSTSEAQP